MKLIKQIEFARACKVTVNTIKNNINRGSLRAFKENGKVFLDLNDPTNREYYSKKTGKPINGNGQRIGQDPDGGEESPDVSAELQARLRSMLGVDATFAEFDELTEAFTNKLKTLQQIQDLKLRTDKARMKLIDRNIVRRMFGRIYSIDVNEFRMLGMNLAPEIASLINVDDPAVTLKISELVDREVFTILEHVREMLNGFLVELEIRELIGDATN